MKKLIVLVLAAFLGATFFPRSVSAADNMTIESDIGKQYVWGEHWQSDFDLYYNNDSNWAIKDFSLGYHQNDLLIKLGRASLKWGPGEESLILNDRQGFDMLYVEDVWEIFGLPIHWQEFWANLNARAGSKRRLFGHRVTTQWGNWRLGAAETVVLSGDYSDWFYNPVPFCPYYLTQHLLRKKQHYDNTYSNVLAQIDLSWENEMHDRFYGVAMVDDAPGSPPNDDVPGRAGLQLGFNKNDFIKELGLRGEYTGISRYTYTYLTEAGDYTGSDELIGHSLGPDADRLRLEVFRPFGDRMEWTIRTDFERHGEGRFGDRWSLEDGGGYHFLEGAVEYDRRLGAQLGKSWGTNNFVKLLLGYQWIENPNNVVGSDDGFYCELNFRLFF